MKKYLFLLLSGLFFVSCHKNETANLASLTITFENVVDSQALVLNSQTYKNPAGQDFTISQFKYYISNIKLRNTTTGNQFSEPNSYHLVDTKNNSLVSMELKNVMVDNYDEITFSIGVDSLKNHSTAQIGDLDPNNDMAWGWNDGYKFLLLEGKSPYSSTTGLVFHIGEDANYRNLKFDLSNSQYIKVCTCKTAQITFTADINALFKSPNAIDFSTINNVMAGPNATKIADNYASGIFKVKTVD